MVGMEGMFFLQAQTNKDNTIATLGSQKVEGCRRLIDATILLFQKVTCVRDM
jgi:hypothetical protein